MAETPYREEFEAEEQPGQRWQTPISWMGLLLLGWLLYKLTTQPALGAATMCIKFGWEDFRTAWWLRRRDPKLVRGRACFWLYIANGLWKAAVVAFVMGYVLTVVADQVPGQRRGRANAVLGGIGLTLVFGLTLSAVMALSAVWLAHRHGLRLWLHSAVHRACWADDWPPPDTTPPRVNRMGCLLLTGLVLDLAFLVLAVVWAFAVRDETAVFLAGCCALLAIPSLIQFFRACVFKGLWAEAPSDCWGAATGSGSAAEDG
jgi:hypothetical protein